jgi:hypothetical protein
MAWISKELLEEEWEKYSGLKNFLKSKETSFGYDMDLKYAFKDDTLLVLNDRDAYNQIKSNHTKDLKT